MCAHLPSVHKLIDNDISIPQSKYAAIIGENPSAGARSPQLWNAAFRASSINAVMIPLDVSAENLYSLLDALQAEPDFIGGAIAVPYKESVAEWLGDSISDQAKDIGAVNCLFRGKEGLLIGTNTDGEAALVSLQNASGPLASKNVLIFGCGGAGKAVAAYLSSGLDRCSKTSVVCRSSSPGPQLKQSLGPESVMGWSDFADKIHLYDVIVNCTTLGYGDQLELSPISEELLALIKPDAFVFDIVYQPLETKLLSMAAKRGLKTLNGLEMNLEQAVIAFAYANFPDASPQVLDEIREAMLACCF